MRLKNIPLTNNIHKAVIEETKLNQKNKTLTITIHPSIHSSGPYSVQSVGAAEAVSWAIGYNPGWVATPTQDIEWLNHPNKLVLILPTAEG